MSSKKLNEDQQKVLIKTLQTRFEKNKSRHPKTEWQDVENQLIKNIEKLWSIFQMEETSGEPDVVDFGEKDIYFVDCSPESPKRRSLCYDREAWEKRKEHKPENTAKDVAKEFGINFIRRTIPKTTRIRQFRFKNIKLDTNTRKNQKTWWSIVL